MSKRIKLEFDTDEPEPREEARQVEVETEEPEQREEARQVEVETEEPEAANGARQIVFDKKEAEPQDNIREVGSPSTPERRAMASKWPDWDPAPPAVLIRRGGR